MTALFVGTFIGLLALALGVAGCIIGFRRRSNNRKCLIGLFLLLTTWLCAMLAGQYLHKSFGIGSLPLWADYLVVGLAGCSFFISLLGTREMSRRRRSKERVRRGLRRGWLGMALSVCLIAVTGFDIFRAFFPVKQPAPYYGEPVTVNEFEFRFTPPNGWDRLDLEKLNAPGTMAFAHKNPPLLFTILAEKLVPEPKLDLAALVASAKANLIKTSPAAAFDAEQRLARRDLDIVRFEATALIRGGHRFYVYWVTLYRGYSYQLICSGSLREREEVRNQADSLIPVFEILNPKGGELW